LSTINPFLTRRAFIRTAAGAGAVAAFGGLPRLSLARNPTETKLRGLSSFGELKYGPDFKHFGFAQPDAPPGGRFAFQPSYWYFNQNTQTFNTLNSYALKGEAPPRMEYCFDTLMTWAWDEPDALYCALAESVEISADRNTYRFVLRPEAAFSDGSPVTAEDVAFSHMLMKAEGHPQISIDLTELAEAVATDERTVELRFTGKQTDRVILSIANTVPVFSRAFYGKLPFSEHVMELPLGSGPWKVGRFEAGRYIIYERRDDYWANDLPFARGLDHFAELRIDFFQERQAALEAFKKGVVRFREEFTAITWATGYDFPAVTEGKVVKLEIPGEKRPSLQGWAVNARKAKFADPRTRRAIGMVFDFEWTNRNLFHDAYTRANSTFEKSEFVAEGLPSGDELGLLEPYRDELPEAVFGEAVMQFTSDGSGRDRRALREARTLLREAGWKFADGSYFSENGEKLEIEFLIRAQVFERILGPYVENLKALGVAATIRQVDPSQFQSKIESFDFDVAGVAFSFGATPTSESLQQFFHSKTANVEGSHNYPGIAVPAIDALTEEIRNVSSRDELVTAMKALDRVLRAYQFWIPNWYSANHRIAMWDMFGRAQEKPDYFFPVERLWWYDKEKAAAIGAG
jgi:microcin C transport system substrate-binding protein